MSISPTNIKTRIELETRVLAAALKQSFERGDSDGVGLAHRQLYLLLKDQKPGNGSSSVVAETGPTESNGDAANFLESVKQTEEQPEYTEYDQPEVAEYSEAFQTSAQTTGHQEESGESEADQQVDETEHSEEAEQELEEADATDDEQPYESESDQEQQQYVEEEEIPQIRQESDYADEVADKVDESQEEQDLEQAHAIAQYLKYKKTRDQLSAEDEQRSDKVEPLPGWHAGGAAQISEAGSVEEIEAQIDEPQLVEEIEVQAVSAPKPLTEEEEYIRMRKAPPVAKEVLPFDQPSAEYAEIFGSSIIEPAQSQVTPPVIESVALPPTTSPGFSQVSETTPTVNFQPTVPAYNPNAQAGPFDAIPEPPSYGQFISSSPPSSHEPEPVVSAFVEPQIPASYAEVVEPQLETQPNEPEFDNIKAGETIEVAQLQEQVEAFDAIESTNREETSVALDDSQEGWETLEPAEVPDVDLDQAPKPKRGFIEEPIQEDVRPGPDLELETELELEPEPGIKPVPHTDRDPQSTTVNVEGEPEQFSETEDETAGEPDLEREAVEQIPPPPKFEGFYAPENLGVKSLASGFAPPPEASDLPPELRKPPTAEFPKVLQNTTQDLPMVGQNYTQDSPMVAQNPTQDAPVVGQNLTQDLPLVEQPSGQDLPMVGQNSTQDLPQIMNDIRSQQAADYAARKANQSSPRKMPAIDFSLQSESSKPDIDFSLQSETQAPNIDFTTQPKSNKPDIDFSLQSESNKPDIDFSLQSESQIPESLNAPTGGGFIEAEFVSSDPDLPAEFEKSQDVTSELPVLNPAASLYLEPDETDESQTQKLAAEQLAAQQLVAQQTAAERAEALAPQPAVPPEPPKSTVPYTGIPIMMVPNHAAPPAVKPTPDASDAAETTGQEEPLPAAPKPPDLYAMLGVSQMSPFEEIHKNFLRKIRKILLKLRGAVRPERDELLKELRRNWVARDILCDPVTRTDYDFRDMGLRGSPDGAVAHVEDGPQRIGQRTPLRIGELLQCAGLLEQAELEIACDMHKAMPEVQFGTFLVRQGFIQERDLDSVLLGQSLLRDGKITVAQFQVAMELSQSRGANISDTLIEHGYITAAELAKLTEKAAEPADLQAGDTPTIKEVAVKPRQIEPAAPTNLNASSAVPTWKDQLDWSKPLPVDDDASLMDRNPEKQSLADLLGNVNTDVAEPEKVKISNNAAPSWKDQLDWEQPSDTAVSDATTDGADEKASSEQQAISEDSPNPISTANAVPSWKDQLDWEQPKEESQTQSQDSGNISGTVENSEEEEYYDDEPMIHSSKETQPISIHPPTSVAPNVTLGKGNSGTASNTNKESTPENEYLQEVLQTTDIFEQTIDTGTTEAAHDDHSDGEHDEHDEDEHAAEEGEGFLKKTLGKLKKGDPKDKDKKKKRK